MGIKHVDTKASGDLGYATEWNKDHEIDGDVECAKHQHKEHVIENRTDFPAGPVVGQVIYRTDEKVLYVWDGTGWVPHTPAILKGTYYASIPGSAFTPKNPDVDDHEISIAGVILADGAFIANASIQLPHGATITGVIVYGNDATETWNFLRHDLTTDAAAGMASANINTEDNTIINPVVDNQTYSYHFKTSILDAADIIRGARVTYTL